MDIDELKVALKISENDENYDELISRLYALAKEIFTQNTRVVLDPTSKVDIFTNINSDVIYLYFAPVNSITSIKTKNKFNEAWKDCTIDYYLDNSVLYFDSILTSRLVKIEYEVGYSTIPDPILQILISLMDFMFNYDATKTYLSGNGELLLKPKDVAIPKMIRENMAIYRVGL